MATTTNYIWDDQNYLAEADATNTINVVYTNEPQGFGNLVSSRISGTTSYHHFDALGSTRQLTNAAGGVTDAMVYDAWGNVVNRTGSTVAALLWIGELGYYFDVETSLIHMRQRSYAPAVARWTSCDLLFLLGIITDLYRYAYNNAVLWADPSGLQVLQFPACGKADCERCLKEDNQIIQTLVAYLQAKPPFDGIRKKKCDVPKIECCGRDDKREECEKTCRGGIGPTHFGKFLPKPPKVVLCAEKIRNPESANVEAWKKCTGVFETLIHEMYHAAEECEPVLDRPESECDQCLCGEITAYRLSGNCDVGSLYYYQVGHVIAATAGFKSTEHCLAESAAQSCLDYPPCKKAGFTGSTSLAKQAATLIKPCTYDAWLAYYMCVAMGKTEDQCKRFMPHNPK